MVTQLVGLFGACLLAANALFQHALAAGVRWGNAAFGGKAAHDDGSLLPRSRVMSLVSAAIMGFLIMAVLSASSVGNTSPMDAGFATFVCKGATVLFALNTAGNLASDNKIERWVMGSATVCLTISFSLIGWVF